MFFPPLRLAAAGMLAFAGLVCSAGAFASEEGQAQKILPTEGITITSPTGKAQHFKVEMAVTPQEQEVGEMFRTSVPEDRGMLFVWPAPQISNMWMRNTLVPLDMVFIAPDGRIIDIQENTVPHSEASVTSNGVVKWTLELAGGTAEKRRIFVGDEVTLDRDKKPSSENKSENSSEE